MWNFQLFAKAGYHVCLYDVNEMQITNALETCKNQLKKMEEDGLFQNKKTNADDIFDLINGSSNLNEALKGSIHIQV